MNSENGNLSVSDNKFAFVVLHYGKSSTTEKTINNLIEVRNDCSYPFYIVIVDNGSPDHADNLFKETYKDIKDLYVVRNDSNLGFSKGMNAGFIFAKKELHSDYIVLMNNDIEVMTHDICRKSIEDFEKHGYAVLGPKIHNADENNLNRNPNYTAAITPSEKLKNIRHEAFKVNYKLFFAHLRMLERSESFLNRLKNLYWKLSKKQGARVQKTRSDADTVVLGTGLHGCFWIFSPLYVNAFDGLEEVTFAYGEEWLLYHRCDSNHMQMMYDPGIEVFHSEHMVMKSIAQDTNKQFIYRGKLQKDSLVLQKQYVKHLLKKQKSSR